ncbi:hypothetical protein I8751_11945 [Nostocaceae cyanobacterium CENA357]|uniref:Uncharacterized protein n=1 Tax=Atlanticothrix silvestris CENA357 TaxID=1725252 RepID=A0A8J7HHA7_9CYAN|nr:hypothetical protein [Atlanticothrix silvestris]MBH8553065.1 hypothetical protein [Atlanticothrix silvestris CENA357]
MKSIASPLEKMVTRFLKKIVTGEPKLFQTDRKEILDKAIHASEKVSHLLEGIEEIQAIGVSRSDKGYSVKINLTSPLPTEVASKVPEKLEGVPIETEVVGQVFVLT